LTLKLQFLDLANAIPANVNVPAIFENLFNKIFILPAVPDLFQRISIHITKSVVSVLIIATRNNFSVPCYYARTPCAEASVFISFLYFIRSGFGFFVTGVSGIQRKKF
jgi:hypothetical protein